MITTSARSAATLACVCVGVAACGFSTGASTNGGDAPSTTAAPTVLSSEPISGATGVPLDTVVRATFSEGMDPATLTAASFELTAGAARMPVAGTVTYADTTASFRPSAPLASEGVFTATITTHALSEAGVALATARSWSFVGTNDPHQVPVNLRTAGNYALLAQASIAGVTATVTGNVAVSPAAASYITGFSLAADASNTFATSAQIAGRVYAASYAAPTPAILTDAITDLHTAYGEAIVRAPDISELDGGGLGGLQLSPGVYRWSTGVTITTDLTLDGGPGDVWIFEIADTLALSASVHVVLAGGAVASHVFWVVTGGPTTLAAMAHLEGIVLTPTAVTCAAGASINGRVLSQTSIDVGGSTVVQPAT